MAYLNAQVSGDYLDDIANAIREISGEETEYTLLGMPAAVRALELEAIDLPEEPDDEWTYNGVNYIITEENDVRYLTRVVNGVVEKTAIPEQISVKIPPKKRFYHIRKGQSRNIYVETSGIAVQKKTGNSWGTVATWTRSPATVSKGGVHEITVSWSFMGFDYSDSFMIEVLDENETVLVTNQYLKNLASAIRSLTGKTRLYRVPEMVQALKRLRYKSEPNNVDDIETSYPYLEITRLPTKTHYETYTGGTVQLDYSGVIVSVVSADGNRTAVTDQCKFLPEAGTVLTNAMEGLNTIAVTYETEDEYGPIVLGASFEINLAVAVEGEHGRPVKIRVNKRPDQKTYVIEDGESYVTLDHSGLIVKAIYKDGFKRTITDQCLVDPGTGGRVYEREGTSTWKQKCNVTWFDRETYQNFHTSFKVTIVDANDGQTTSEETISWVDPEVTTYTDGGTTYIIHDDGSVEEAAGRLSFDKLPMDIPQYYGLYYDVDFQTVMRGVTARATVGGESSAVVPVYRLAPASFTTQNSWRDKTGTALIVKIFATYRGRSAVTFSKIMPWDSYILKYPHAIHVRATSGFYTEGGELIGYTDGPVDYWCFSINNVGYNASESGGAYGIGQVTISVYYGGSDASALPLRLFKASGVWRDIGQGPVMTQATGGDYSFDSGSKTFGCLYVNFGADGDISEAATSNSYSPSMAEGYDAYYIGAKYVATVETIVSRGVS